MWTRDRNQFNYVSKNKSDTYNMTVSVMKCYKDKIGRFKGCSTE